MDYIYSILDYFFPKTESEYIKVSVITPSKEKYVKLYNSECLKDEIHLNLVSSPGKCVIDDITVVDSKGRESSEYNLLRKYFGPDCSYWVNTVDALSWAEQLDIVFLSIYLKSSDTDELKVLEFDRTKTVFIGI